MIQKLDHRNEMTAKSIQKIQRPAYLIEAQLMGFDGIPQIKESFRQIQDCEEVFIGYLDGKTLLGFISFKIEAGIVDIHRLVVDPGHFRRGIGRQLLHFLLENFKEMAFTVSTGRDNIPAKKLYGSFGFIEIEDFEVAPGIYCTAFKRMKSNSETEE